MSEKSNEFTREYIFNNPLMPPVMCRPNCCLFCGECKDIFYDLLTERHWFENEDVPENYERDLEHAVYNSAMLKEQETEWEHLWDAPDGTFKGRCKKCGFVHFFIEGHDTQYKFCPWCGRSVKLK